MAVDECGVTPGRALAARSARRVRAVLLQPRAHNPDRRVDDRGARAGAGAHPRARTATPPTSWWSRTITPASISMAPDVSLGRWLPDRVIHVRSFSKSHGPDLRIAALGGPSAVIDRIVARRMLGPGWTSRMLQRILYDLLTDAAAAAQVEPRPRHLRRSASAPWSRRSPTRASRSPQPDGINLWLPVVSERAAIVQLAADEIRVAPGSPFLGRRRRRGRPRVRARHGRRARRRRARAGAGPGGGRRAHRRAGLRAGRPLMPLGRVTSAWETLAPRSTRAPRGQ